MNKEVLETLGLDIKSPFDIIYEQINGLCLQNLIDKNNYDKKNIDDVSEGIWYLITKSNKFWDEFRYIYDTDDIDSDFRIKNEDFKFFYKKMISEIVQTGESNENTKSKQFNKFVKILSENTTI